MSYDKEILVPSTTVAGNIKDHNQSYEIVYYPRANDLIDKVALYIFLGDRKAIRSVYFSSLEQLKTLIQDLTKSYFYFVDKRIVVPDSAKEEFRMVKLSDFLKEIRDKQLNLWRK